MFNNATASIKLHYNTDKYMLEQAISQGDTIFPQSITAVLEYAFKELDWAKQGINMNDEYLSHLGFVDDIVLIAESLSVAHTNN